MTLPLLADKPVSLDIAGNPTVGMWGYQTKTSADPRLVSYHVRIKIGAFHSGR